MLMNCYRRRYELYDRASLLAECADCQNRMAVEACQGLKWTVGCAPKVLAYMTFREALLTMDDGRVVEMPLSVTKMAFQQEGARQSLREAVGIGV
jgi:hypothetical protein